jgi:predicted acylesterase/phospholipase RssA
MTTRPARRTPSPQRPPARIGLALAGGGPLGGIYEVGALLALADSIDGLDLTRLDVYVGVSSGGFVAAALANGLSPSQMHRLFIAGGADAALKPELFLRPALREFVRRAATVPSLLGHAALQYLRDPFHRGALASFAALSRAMPTGLFDNRGVDAFLAGLFAGPGRTDDFRKLRKPLYLVATHLDTGASVNFGAPGHDHVPISQAIRASSALPGMFPPVEIDGEHYVDGALNKTLHASLALDSGVDLLLCVNPLVPFDVRDAQPRHGRGTAQPHERRGEAQALGPGGVDRLAVGGLPLVLSQTFRAIIHSRMSAGMDKYRRQYPHADVLLFEPARGDADMFFANIFGYAQRERLCATAYDTTREGLRQRAGRLAPVLRRHGLALVAARLRDRDRTIADALCDPRPLHTRAARPRRVRDTARELAHTLDHLERQLAALR